MESREKQLMIERWGLGTKI